MSLLRRRMMKAKKRRFLPESSTRGVYIEAVSGFLYEVNDWDGSETPNGVAVFTDDCRFIVALHEDTSLDYQWSNFSIKVNGITTTQDSSVAMNDYAGEAQTTTILNVLGSDAPAAYACRAYTFPNGQKGYLGAAGEWLAVFNNRYDIYDAIKKCGGDDMQQSYQASTQYDADFNWGMSFSWTAQGLVHHLKWGTRGVRAFGSITQPGHSGGVM